MRISVPILARGLAALAAVAAARPARAFLGFGDTSFVTVIANPAEAANWAAELESLNNQLAAARSTLDTVALMRAYAGDPRAAVASLADLAAITSEIATLSSGAQTGADLERAWQDLSAAERLAGTSRMLAGAGATMDVFGQAQPRDLGLYAASARDADASSLVRSQIAGEQGARASVASELALAWSQFRAAPTESSKQAILAEISQLQSQDQVMDARRRAMLDDLSLSDREERNGAGVRARAADEQLLSESALLGSAAQGRARDAEAQRAATLQKQAQAPAASDYGGLRLWTTADAGGSPP